MKLKRESRANKKLKIMSYQGFEELEVWKKAREVKKEIFEHVKTFPSAEKFRLTDQLVRSIRSVPNQIAEGHGRRTLSDRLRFSIIARGSFSESLNHLIDAFDCNYISEEQLTFYRTKINEVERIMNGYTGYLEKNIKK
jgi:four helix bundle protein